MTNIKQSFWTEKIQIKNISIPRFMSAPIDGMTDSPMRQLIHTFSPEILLFTQMHATQYLINDADCYALKYNSNEHPICFQISTNNTNDIEKVIDKILESKFDMINLNACCPAKKIIKNGAGSALMANPTVLTKIIKKIKRSINEQIPFTIKLRAGFKETNALEICKLSQDLGIDAIIIHPRLQTGGFSSNLDFKLVEKIKKQISIPIIFSGEIKNFEDTQKTYNLTNVDGFMIGRALYGAPWKIQEIIQESQNQKFNLSLKEIIKIALEHFALNGQYYGENESLVHQKKHIPHYIKNIDGAAQIRNKIVRSETTNELKEILNKLL